MKKILLFVILFISIIMVGCVPEGFVRLPNLNGLNREEISNRLDRLNLKYKFVIRPQVYNDESEFDQFVEYGRDLKIGEIIDVNTFLYVYTTALPLTVDRLDEVQLTTDYQGKSFVNDGIGEVTLDHNVDGDTAHFFDVVTGEEIKARFLGIDTPEWTTKHDPWGDEASAYTAEKLSNANIIVLESEGNNRVDTYGRYLSWVWVDGKLLNLEILQEAYSSSKISSDSKYFDIFTEIESAVSKTGRRFFGEIDPNFNYTD